MGSIKNKTSVAIFYDGNYLNRVSKYYGLNNIVKYRLNISALHHYILDEVTSIASDILSDIYVASSHYYANRHSAAEAVNRKSQLHRDRITDDILGGENIDAHYTTYSATPPYSDDSYISSWLSLDLLDENRVKDFDLVVIIAADSGYIPLINKLNSKGIETMVVGWDTVMSVGNIVDIKTDDRLFLAAKYTIVVNVAIDQFPDKLDKLLSPIMDRNHEHRAEPQVTSESEDDKDSEEVEISEVVTLRNNYGFIRFPDNNLFFRSQDYNGDFDQLKVGDVVEFVLHKGADEEYSAKKVEKATSNLNQFDDENETYQIDENFIDWEK